MTDNVFHAHLDVCKQCRNNPAFLCSVGVAALRETVEQGARNAPSLDANMSDVLMTSRNRTPEIDPVIHERILAATHTQADSPRILDTMGHSPEEADLMRKVADQVFGKGFAALMEL